MCGKRFNFIHYNIWFNLPRCLYSFIGFYNKQKAIGWLFIVLRLEEQSSSLFGCAERLLGDGLIERLQRRYGLGIKEAYKRFCNANVIT